MEEKKPVNPFRAGSKAANLWQHNAIWRAAYNAQQAKDAAKPAVKTLSACAHLGEATGSQIECMSCKGSVRLILFACAIYGDCTIGKKVGEKACCDYGKCPSFAPKQVKDERAA